MGLDPTGIVSAGLDLLGGIGNAQAARSAFKHRYQDTVKDMKKAGLNPALAYGQGGGNPQTVPLPEIGSSYARGTQQGASARQAQQQAELTAAQTDLLKAQTKDILRKTTAEADTAQSTSQKAGVTAQEALAWWQTVGDNPGLQKAFLAELHARGLTGDLADLEKDLRTSAASEAATSAKVAKLGIPEAQANSDFYSGKFGHMSPYIQAILQVVGKFMSPLNLLRQGNKVFNTHNYLPRGK